jgi:hypothetical protein
MPVKTRTTSEPLINFINNLCNQTIVSGIRWIIGCSDLLSAGVIGDRKQRERRRGDCSKALTTRGVVGRGPTTRSPTIVRTAIVVLVTHGIIAGSGGSGPVRRATPTLGPDDRAARSAMGLCPHPVCRFAVLGDSAVDPCPDRLPLFVRACASQKPGQDAI